MKRKRKSTAPERLDANDVERYAKRLDDYGKRLKFVLKYRPKHMKKRNMA